MTADPHLHDLIDRLHSAIPTDLLADHPAVQSLIDQRFQDMRKAADNGDAATLAKISKAIEPIIHRAIDWNAGTIE